MSKNTENRIRSFKQFKQGMDERMDRWFILQDMTKEAQADFLNFCKTYGKKKFPDTPSNEGRKP